MKQERSNKYDLLKWIAIISMTVNHIGLVFFSQYSIFQKIGRLAMPIFCFGIALGYKKTSNFKKYFLTLLFFGLISQVPYDLLWNSGKLNIIIGLTLGLIFIHLINVRANLWAFLVLVLSLILDIEYGWLTLILILIFYKFNKNKWVAFGLLFIATFLYVQATDRFVQWYSLVGFCLILFMPETKWKFALNKYFFYFYYPIHLLILYILSVLL